MSIALKPIVTKAGLEAVINASHDGLKAQISQVALGDGGYEPECSATALKSERNRIAIIKGTPITSAQIHITAIENGEAEYWVREIGFILEGGTLLALWSHPTQALRGIGLKVDHFEEFNQGYFYKI